MLNTLIALGLTKNEAQVYLALLPLGNAPASILAKKVNQPRTTVKGLCEQLVRAGLLRSTARANAVIYAAEPPERLMSLLNEEKARLNEKEEGINRIMSELKRLYNPSSILPQIKFYDGIEGVKKLYEIMVDNPDDLISFGAGDYFLDKTPEIIESFRKKAYSKPKTVKVIRSQKYKIRHHKDPEWIQTRYFRKIEELLVDIQVSKNLISIASINQNMPVGIIITNSEIAKTITQIFEELWEQLKN